MEATIKVDEELLDRASRATGIKERDELVREALEGLIQSEAARRLIERGGTEPEIELAPRRRQETN